MSGGRPNRASAAGQPCRVGFSPPLWPSSTCRIFAATVSFEVRWAEAHPTPDTHRRRGVGFGRENAPQGVNIASDFARQRLHLRHQRADERILLSVRKTRKVWNRRHPPKDSDSLSIRQSLQLPRVNSPHAYPNPRRLSNYGIRVARQNQPKLRPERRSKDASKIPRARQLVITIRQRNRRSQI